MNGLGEEQVMDGVKDQASGPDEGLPPPPRPAARELREAPPVLGVT